MDQTEEAPLLQPFQQGASAGPADENSSSNANKMLSSNSSSKNGRLAYRSTSSRRDDSMAGEYTAMPAAPPAPEEEHGSTCRTCKICLGEEDGLSDGDPDNPLISPCLCSGSSKYVHRHCLKKWRESNPQSHAYYRCEICHYEYRFRRAAFAAVLGSPVTSGIILAIMLVSATLLMGFVPIIQGLMHIKGHPLLHVLDGLIMVGLIGFVIMIVYLCAYGSSSLAGHDHCNCIYCYGGDCGSCDCGSDSGSHPVILVVLAIMAIAGLTFAMVKGYMLLYGTLWEHMSHYMVMVENVGGADAAVAQDRKRKGRAVPGAHTFTLKPPVPEPAPQVGGEGKQSKGHKFGDCGDDMV